MSKRVFVSLGNEKREDDKVILDGKEIDLSKIGYFVLTCDGPDRKWIIANRKPDLQTLVELLIQHLRTYLKLSETK